MDRQRVTIDGAEYESVHAMPADARRLYESALAAARPALADRDGNGVPDLLEGGAGAGVLPGVRVERRVVVNGTTYRSLGELPAELRPLVERAIAPPAGAPGAAIRTSEVLLELRAGGPAGLSRVATGAPARPGPGGPVEVTFRLRPWMLVAGLVIAAAVVLWMLAGAASRV